jgi:hypothetical protein
MFGKAEFITQGTGWAGAHPECQMKDYCGICRLAAGLFQPAKGSFDFRAESFILAFRSAIFSSGILIVTQPQLPRFKWRST